MTLNSLIQSQTLEKIVSLVLLYFNKDLFFQ